MVRRIAFAVGALVMVSLTALSTYLGLGQMREADAQATVIDGPAQRNDVIEVVKADVPKLFNYTPDTVDSLSTTVRPLLTPEFANEFTHRILDEVAPQARQRGLTSQVLVAGCAVETLSAGDASLIVFMNQTFSGPDTQPVYNGTRLRVRLLRQSGSWLVHKIDVI